MLCVKKINKIFLILVKTLEKVTRWVQATWKTFRKVQHVPKCLKRHKVDKTTEALSSLIAEVCNNNIIIIIIIIIICNNILSSFHCLKRSHNISYFMKCYDCHFMSETLMKLILVL